MSFSRISEPWLFSPWGECNIEHFTLGNYRNSDRKPGVLDPSNGGLVRETTFFEGKSRLVKDCSIWPDLDWQLGSEHYKNIQKPSIWDTAKTFLPQHLGGMRGTLESCSKAMESWRNWSNSLRLAKPKQPWAWEKLKTCDLFFGNNRPQMYQDCRDLFWRIVMLHILIWFHIESSTFFCSDLLGFFKFPQKAGIPKDQLWHRSTWLCSTPFGARSTDEADD